MANDHYQSASNASSQRRHGAINVFIAAVVLSAIVVIIMLATRAGNPEQPEAVVSHDSYTITARFDNVAGLKPDSAVTASGVTVGRVSDIGYDIETYEAVVSLSIDTRYDRFPVDTAASVLSTGLFGDKYIDLQPGAEDIVLKNGDVIDLTQSAMILEQLIGQFIYNQAPSGGDDMFEPETMPDDVFIEESGMEQE